jgi:hypothetical protein
MIRSLRWVLILFGISFLAEACGSSSEVPVLDGGGQGSTRDGGSQATTGLFVSSYRHVSDSDGAQTVEGGETWMAFHSSGAAFLLAATETDAIAREGTFQLDAANAMSLRFATEDFSCDAHFSIDPAAETVTFPFKVFSSGNGTSTWKRDPDGEPLARTLSILFQSATLSRETSTSDAVAFAAAHADAVCSSQASGGNSHETIIEKVEAVPNGVRVYYRKLDGMDNPPLPLNVVLFSNVRYTVTALSASQLVSDPRVNLEVLSTTTGADDPASKSAVFIVPFYSSKRFDWYNVNPLIGLAGTPAPVGSPNPFGAPVDAMQKQLEASGYSVEPLLDGKVTVESLVANLAPSGGAKTPGFIFYFTHGALGDARADGAREPVLATATTLDLKNREAAARAEYARLAKLYPDLVTFDGGTVSNPKTLEPMFIQGDGRPSTNQLLLSINATFFEWLTSKRGADFGSSFVYTAACESADSTWLAESIRPRAFFGHKGTISTVLQQGLFEYFVRSLVRHTHSAEEAYYNIIRVQNTGQMIYLEDTALNGKVRVLTSPASRDANSLIGYALDSESGQMKSLQETGWFKTPNTMPVGIWWLLFGGRWGRNAKTGSQNLLECWNQFWSKGNPGGMTSPGCNAMTPGYVPSEEEVAYASYLLTGAPALPIDLALVPRFTLHDGDAK